VQPSHANSLAHTSTHTYAKTLAQTDSLRGFPLGGLTMPSFMPNHWPMGFPPQEVFPFYFFTNPNFSAEHYFPHLAMLPQGCEDPQFPGGGQTAPKLPHALANTTKSSTRVTRLS
jgi:hypothetical protein